MEANTNLTKCFLDYQTCHLGKHVPITKDLRSGILRVGQKTVQRLSKETVDEWFNQYSKSLGKILHYFSGRNLSVHIVSSGQSEADPKNKIKREGLNPQLGKGGLEKDF